MAQQLIIQNDEDEDYVQFTVEIPDGYAGFNITSINGTMINQNYLNIGDVLRFKFSNNPIIYNQRIDLNITNMSSANDLKDSYSDMNEYEFISLDMFKIYKVKYVPIYSYYDTDANDAAYVFNPADEDELLDNPIKIVKEYEIQTSPSIKCPFTGQYVITLKEVDKIDDIDVIVGESVPNSKTQSSDISINEAGEIIPENQQGTTYNYASHWRYDVANLLMNHRMSVYSGIKVENTIKLVYTVWSKKSNREFTTPYYNFNDRVISSSFYLPWSNSPLFKFYTFEGEATVNK